MLTRDSKASHLKRVPLFSGLRRRELTAIAGITTEAAVASGQEIVREGDDTRDFYVLVSGAADVARDGKPLATLGPGDFFGEIAILLGARRNATVTATSSAHLLVVDRDGFFALMHEYDGLHRKVIDAFAARMAPTAP